MKIKKYYFLLLPVLGLVGCGKAKITTSESHVHKYGSWINEVPAECEIKGVKGHYHCAECGKNFDANHNQMDSIDIDALGHNYGEWIVGKASTCEEDGVKDHYHCDTCGEDFDVNHNRINTLIEMTGHTWSHYLKLDATETNPGHEEFWNCNNCEKLVLEKPESGTVNTIDESDAPHYVPSTHPAYIEKLHPYFYITSYSDDAESHSQFTVEYSSDLKKAVNVYQNDNYSRTAYLDDNYRTTKIEFCYNLELNKTSFYTEYSYDDSGNLVCEESYADYGGDELSFEDRKQYIYENNVLVELDHYYGNSSDDVWLQYRTYFEYTENSVDEQKFLVNESGENDYLLERHSEIVTVDLENNTRIVENKAFIDQVRPNYSSTYVTIYALDSGKLLTAIDYDTSGDEYSRYTYTYNELGLLFSIKYQDCYMDEGIHYFEYDEKAFLSKVTYKEGGKTLYFYDVVCDEYGNVTCLKKRSFVLEAGGYCLTRTITIEFIISYIFVEQYNNDFSSYNPDSYDAIIHLY